MQIDYTFRLKNFIFIALGAAIYAFGFVYFNMAIRLRRTELLV